MIPKSGYRFSVKIMPKNPRSISFAEARGDQRLQGIDGGSGLRSGGANRDRRSRRRGEHHQPHDRGAADGFVAARHSHIGVEFFHGLYKFGRGAGVQAFFVANNESANHGVLGGWRVSPAGAVFASSV